MPTPQSIDPALLFDADAPTSNRVIVDVRSPSEFSQGHIPGSINIALFDDDERAAVGTLYKQRSREAAIEKGLEFIGPRLAELVRSFKAAASSKELLIYCWRGGMRSESVAWLLELAGLDVVRLQGGYKGYRKFIRCSFSKPARMLILGGHTGSGKTALILAVAELGLQVIDLEGLANHKGSAFGHIDEQPQVSSEQFENDLAKVWLGFDHTQTILIENESRMIGTIHLPEPFWLQMRTAPLLSVDCPREARVARLVEDYGTSRKEDLLGAVSRVEKKFDTAQLADIYDNIRQGELAPACHILLQYYDRCYQNGIDRRELSAHHHIAINGFDLAADSRKLLDFIRGLEPLPSVDKL
ncbi:MAG: tRNA 2-selenouridine(34) synthase MnmH [Thermodesulfobacteriota bacterium]